MRVLLNGQDVTPRFEQGACSPSGCLQNANLSIADGLRRGQNRMTASARKNDRRLAFRRILFSYYAGDLGGGTSNTVAPYLPASIGFKVPPFGVFPIVQLTTGWPAHMPDSDLDTSTYAAPYRDTALPDPTTTQQCTTNYQVLELQRTNPALVVDNANKGYTCIDSDADLAAYLKGLSSTAAGKEIVIAGTSARRKAGAALNTEAIGGTNYTLLAATPNFYPEGYLIIGVPGAAAGSAYENYYVPADGPWGQYPAASGSLNIDQNANYNFQPNGVTEYTVSSNNKTAGTAVTLGSITYTTNGTNGFWLLVVDRPLLRSVNPADMSLCGNDQGGTCGQFFATGMGTSSDQTAAENLAAALNSLTRRQIGILVAVGKPITAPQTITSNLFTAIESHGGSGYLARKLNARGASYVLLTHGAEYDAKGKAIPIVMYSKGTVESTNQIAGQFGYVHGVMAQDNKGLYFAALNSQEDGMKNAPGAQALSLEYDLGGVAAQDRVDWPLTDTQGHLNAYHYVSNRFLMDNGYGKPGDVNGQDLRWYYSGDPALGANANLMNPATTAYGKLPAGANFTQQDLTDMITELHAELLNLSTSDSFLGMNGIQGPLTNTSSGGFASQIISAVGNTELGQSAESYNTSASASDWMNFAAGFLGVLGTTFTDSPGAGVIVGGLSNALWTGSAIGPLGGSSITPPSYENKFDQTIANLTARGSASAAKLVASYGIVLDNIYSDYGRLQYVGNKTGSTWKFQNQIQLDQISNVLTNGALRATYAGLLPQMYSVDTYLAQPVSSPTQLGSWYEPSISTNGYVNYFCEATYPTEPEWTLTATTDGTGSNTDIYVLGGTISRNNSPDHIENMPSSTLQNAVTGLGIGTEELFAGGLLPHRNGPMNGTVGMCYQIGCHKVGSLSAKCQKR